MIEDIICLSQLELIISLIVIPFSIGMLISWLLSKRFVVCKMSEESLSEKRKELFKRIAEEFARYKMSDDLMTAEQRTRNVLTFIKDQDKEVVRRLKDFVYNGWKRKTGGDGEIRIILKEIDKIFGDKLCK